MFMRKKYTIVKIFIEKINVPLKYKDCSKSKNSQKINTNNSYYSQVRLSYVRTVVFANIRDNTF